MKYKKKTYQENTISCEIIYSMVADESKMYKSWNKQDSLEWTEENFFGLFLLFIRKEMHLNMNKTFSPSLTGKFPERK